MDDRTDADGITPAKFDHALRLNFICVTRYRSHKSLDLLAESVRSLLRKTQKGRNCEPSTENPGLDRGAAGLLTAHDPLYFGLLNARRRHVGDP